MSKQEDLGIRMYTTNWCPDCIRAKLMLELMHTVYTEIDVDKSKEGLEIVLAQNNGVKIVPTIFFPDGSVLVEPSNKELREKLISLGLPGSKRG